MKTLDLHNELVINYVDAPPGTGKTRAVIEYMRSHIKAALHRGKSVGYVFYVAPTVDLLEQTLTNLKSVVPKDDQFLIRSIYSTDAIKVKTVDEVYAILDRKKVAGQRQRPLSHGTILFLTHATFVKLKTRHQEFSNTTVFFDESRKWITKKKVNLSTPGVRDIFRSLFDLHPVNEEIKALVARPLAENRKASLMKRKGAATDFATLVKLHTELTVDEDQDLRQEAYVALAKNKRANGTMWVIKMPKQPFVGFKRVIIMSADFENSQMFHLFQYQGIRLAPVTVTFMDKYLKKWGGYGQALKRINERQSCLRLAPLLRFNDVPSIYRNRGFILPTVRSRDLMNLMKAYDIGTGRVRLIVTAVADASRIGAVLEPQEMTFAKKIKGWGIKSKTVQWFVDRSEYILNSHWFSPKMKGPQKALLFVNEENLRAPRKITFNKKLFHNISIGKAEGNNEFKDYSAVAFFPAVNPAPEEARVLKAMLPFYDPEADYIIDKAVQCLGRGNIRNHESKAPMLAIVSTTGLADRIKARLGSETIKIHDPAEFNTAGHTYTYWSPHDAGEAFDGSRRQKYLANPINQELNRQRAKRHKALHRGDAETVSQCDQRIAELIRDREASKRKMMVASYN